MELLSDAEVEAGLADLEGWHRHGPSIRKQYRFSTYMDGIDFVDRVAVLAESANHHPDLIVTWGKVTVSLSTHSEGGLTQKDFDLAQEIESTAVAR